MQSQQVDKMLAAMLETVPHASGVNNHQGSRATADPALMNDVHARAEAALDYFSWIAAPR